MHNVHASLFPLSFSRLRGRSRLVSSGLGLATGALVLALMPIAGSAAAGESLWKFNADFGVTVVEPIADLSGNGGTDALVGSADDSLYLVEGKGAQAGNQLWSVPFKSTLSAATALPDINNDGKPDAVAGDQFGLIQAISGATGQPLWKFLTFGTVLSLAAMPDVDGDGTADVAVGSENDTVYCLSGKPGGALGKSIWEFAVPSLKTNPGIGKAAAKMIVGGRPVAAPPSGANSVAVLKEKNGTAFGLAVGTSSDTVYLLSVTNGQPKWKAGMPGDIWKVAAFPDQDGDGIDEVLAACGADEALLLNGSTGEIIWTHAVSLGATSIAVTEDMDGDGKPDALIGDGNGTVHCVPGVAKGVNVKAAWTFNFGDTSTILSIAALGDLDKDGRADCVVGTSNNIVATLTGKGGKAWSVNLGGEVPKVVSLGDIDGDGLQDIGAGTEMGFAQAFAGGSSGAGLIKREGGADYAGKPFYRLGSGRPQGLAFGVWLTFPGDASDSRSNPRTIFDSRTNFDSRTSFDSRGRRMTLAPDSNPLSTRISN